MQIERCSTSASTSSLAQEPRASAAPAASTASTTATSNSPSARCRATSRLDGLRVVIDCANGAAYKVAPEALWELGADVISIGVEPDGFNINKECGSTAPDALCRKVREMRADIGIALDGDADRVIIVDERGHLVDGDQLLAVIAESWKEDGRLAKPGVVATVMSNLGPGALPASARLSTRAHAGRRPLCARAHARARLQSRRRAVRPHHPVRLHHDRRRLRRGAAGAGGGEEAEQAGIGGLPPFRCRCRRCSRTCAIAAASRWRMPRCARPSQDAEQRLNGHGRLVVAPSGTEPVIRVMGEGDDKMPGRGSRRRHRRRADHTRGVGSAFSGSFPKTAAGLPSL